MSELALPKGWVECPLINISSPKQYKTIPTKDLKDSGYTIYGANGIIGKYDRYTHEEPTLMITCRGASCGNLHISEPLSYINGNAMALDEINKQVVGLDYLYFVLSSSGFSKVITGSAQPQITRASLKSLNLFLAPIAEQKEIVRLLDTHVTTVSQIQARLDAIPKLIEKFRQSVLSDAMSGKLTEGWRDENNLEYAWDKVDLGSISQVNTGKTPLRKDTRYWEDGTIPWLTSSVTGESYCYEANEFVTDVAVKENNLKLFPSGSLLIAMYGEGKTRGQVTELMLEAACNQACAVIEVSDEKALNSFIKLKLKENYVETRKAASGGNQPNLNLSKVRAIKINLPSKEEQEQVVGRVVSLFEYADQIEKSVATAKARVDHLTQSILHQAFTGNLTAEWREQNPDLISGENSAEALLVKIKAEKQGSAKKMEQA